MKTRPTLLLLVALFWTPGVQAADWAQFRGPGGLGQADAAGLPTTWSASENVAWRCELPGLGSSSPIVVQDRVYLTCYTGYGLDPAAPGPMEDLRRHVVCVDRSTGEILWTREFQPNLPESKYSGGNNSWHGYSTSTPASDGERLYVFFGKSGVYCLDLADGRTLWHTEVGDETRGWGSSNSPVLYQDLVIINASVESRALVALNKLSGEEVWRYEGVRGSWNTPLLVDVNGKQELVFSLPEKIVALDPATGDELWTCQGIPDGGYVCPSVVAHQGVVYAIGGRSNTAIAVRAGGRGDVTATHELWRTRKGSNVSSPVYYEGHLYWVHERRGLAICLDAQTGEVVYEERLSPSPRIVYSSAMVADGKIYCVSQHRGTYVIAAKPQFELLAHNAFDDDDHRANASPAVHEGQLLLRNDKYLYCLGTRQR